MHATHGDNCSSVAEPDTEASLRTRTAAADAAFVAEGIANGAAAEVEGAGAVLRRPAATGAGVAGSGQRQAGVGRPLSATHRGDAAQGGP